MNIPQALKTALTHHQSGRLAEAETIYRQVLDVNPRHADALHLLGLIAQQAGHHGDAVELIQMAIALNPWASVFHCNLGISLEILTRRHEALAAYERAIALKRDYPKALANKGVVLKNLGRVDEAIAAYHEAIRLQPDFVDVFSNLGLALGEAGRLDEAIATFEKVRELQPGHAAATFGLSQILLLRGEFERGWPSYEARWDAANCGSPRRDLSQPVWDGGPLEGRRILIHGEQGFGDAIQFVRYAPLVAARGGVVIVECRHPLIELFRSVKGVEAVVAEGDCLPAFDVHVPMLTLPLIFKTTLATIPAQVPYLSADSRRCETWRQRLGCDHPPLRVGIAWAGSPTNRRDHVRSIALEQLQPLLEIRQAEFFSLQRDRGPDLIRQIPAASVITDHTRELHSFADTAALVSQLDLVISVDSAVLHLAGALGRPVWGLIPFAPDWRWLLGRADSPWYPTMRLFRQECRMDWRTAIAAICNEVRHIAGLRETAAAASNAY